MRAREGAQIAAGAMLASAERLPIAVWVRQMRENVEGGAHASGADGSEKGKGRGLGILSALAQNQFASEADPTWANAAPYILGSEPNRVCRLAQASMHPVRATPTDDSGFSDNPWQVYERHKRLIASTSRSPADYETRIRALAARLGL
jgi:hypothetical protein